MADRADRAHGIDRSGQPPRSHGWRQRAEQVRGQLALDRSLTLSASEIGAYTFCPQAWYLQRCRLPVTAESEARRRSGSRKHREIGRQTDLVRAAGALQVVLLIAIGVVLLLIMALALRGLA